MKKITQDLDFDKFIKEIEEIINESTIESTIDSINQCIESKGYGDSDLYDLVALSRTEDLTYLSDLTYRMEASFHSADYKNENYYMLWVGLIRFWCLKISDLCENELKNNFKVQK